MKSTAAAGNFCASTSGCFSTARRAPKATTTRTSANKKTLSTSFRADLSSASRLSEISSQRRLAMKVLECSASSGIAASEKKTTFRPERNVAQAVNASSSNWLGLGRLEDKAREENVARSSKAK